MEVNFRIYTNGCHMLYPPYSHDYGTKKGVMDSVLFFYPNGIWGVGIIKKKEISAIAHHSNSILMMDTGQKK